MRKGFLVASATPGTGGCPLSPPEGTGHTEALSVAMVKLPSLDCSEPGVMVQPLLLGKPFHTAAGKVAQTPNYSY